VGERGTWVRSMSVTSPPPPAGPPVPAGWAVIPQPSPLAPVAVRVTPGRQAVAFAFVPAGEYAGYLSTVPDRAAEFAEGHRAYRVAVQQHIGEFLRLTRDGGIDPQPYVVAIRMVAFTLWCAQAGASSLDPAARAAYAACCADEPGHPDVTAWPPRGHQPCWCGSAARYRQCCGHPAVAAPAVLN
jgi:hypothetical protein